MKHITIYILALFIFSACLNEPQLPVLTNNYNLEDIIQLAVNDEVSIGEENINLKFLKVRDESRCPETWKCLWEGEAEIELQFQKGESTEIIRLKYDGGICTTCGNAASVFGYKIQLEQLTPYPNEAFYAKKPMTFDDYQIVISVSNDDSEVYI